jgi:hypothetical protein
MQNVVNPIHARRFAIYAPWSQRPGDFLQERRKRMKTKHYFADSQKCNEKAVSKM